LNAGSTGHVVDASDLFTARGAVAVAVVVVFAVVVVGGAACTIKPSNRGTAANTPSR
jgi:hypothetical protein